MANTSITYQIFDSIVKALKPLGVKVFLTNRPTTSKTIGDTFVVVDLPTQFRRLAAGYDDFSYKLVGVIYAFCRANTDGTPNIDKQTRFVREIVEIFPFTSNRAECSNPIVLMKGSDEYGFQLTTITFNIRTK